MSRQQSPEQAAADRHVRFIYASLTLAVGGGFALAVWLPAAAALGHLDVSWLAFAQVHGHVQVIGFAGLFVLGVLTKLAPRFGNGHEVDHRLMDIAFWCLLTGLVMRAVAQPFAGQGTFGAMLAVGAVIEFVGAAAAATAVGAVVWDAAMAGAPHALLILSGLGWWMLQAALSAGWCIGLAMDGGTLIRGDRNAVLLVMQVYGFPLCVFAGVGLRTFPTFFAMPAPSLWLGRAAAVLIGGGVLAWSAGGLVGSTGRDLDVAIEAGQASVGAGILVLISATGWWRREMRLAAASQPLGWALRMTLVALTVAGTLLAGTGVLALVRGAPTSPQVLDAVRHVFTVGVVTQGIVVMAQLILPEFASERLVHRPPRWRGVVLGAGLASAAVLRGLAPLANLDATLELWLMAAGGGIAFVCVATFAVMFVRARRMHVAYLAKVAKWRMQPIEVRGAPPGAV